MHLPGLRQNVQQLQEAEPICKSVSGEETNFVGEEANIEEISGSTSQYSYFIGHTDYIQNGTKENIKVNVREINTHDERNWSITDASFKEAMEADWTTGT